MSPLPFEIALLGLFSFALGLVIGSFLNVVIHRVPLGQSVVAPRSRCPACERSIPWAENVPLLSYLWLRGRCRGCGVAISVRYPLMEAATGVVFMLLALVYGPVPMLPVWMAFAATLIAAAAIDFEHHWIPDEISVGGLAVGLAVVPAVHALSGESYAQALAQSALGALLGGGLLWMVGFVHARFSAGLGRRFEHWPEDGEPYPRFRELDYWMWFPGLGFGDVKLLAMIGAFVGPARAVETIALAAAAGLLLGIGWAIARRSWSSPFGFAPAIALGALIVLISPVSLLRFH